jgi:hypothetical protein
MKKWFYTALVGLFAAAIFMFALTSLAEAQTYPAPPSLTIAVTEKTDGTTQFRFSWQTVPGYSTYDLLTFSRPRIFELEQLRAVTGTSWTITVPRSALTDSMFIYGSVRVSPASPRYASIVHRLPPLSINALDVKPDSVSLMAGETQQFCAFVVFEDGKMAMRTPEKTLPVCVAQYDSLPISYKPPSPLQQSIADTVQVQWSVVDGAPSASTVKVSSPIREVWIIRP